MKSLYMVVLLLIPMSVSAGEFTVKVKTVTDNSQEELMHMQDGTSIQIDYRPNKGGAYYFAEHIKTTVYAKSPAFDIEFKGLGIGSKKSIWDSVSVYGQIGYYITDTSRSGRFDCEPAECEGLYYGLNGKWSDAIGLGNIHFNEYEIDATDALGMAFGIELAHPISENGSFVFGLEHQVMQYTLSINGMADIFRYDNTGQRIETFYKGHSSTNVYAGFKWILR